MKLLKKPNQFYQSFARYIFAAVNGRKKIKKIYSTGTLLSVVLMIFCLTFLTSLNYFIYSSDSEVITQNTSPSGPTEEKSGNTGFSITEEILHESSFEFDRKFTDDSSLKHIAEAEKLQIIHPELILRPPRS
ncbi:MAG: hypothetical protein JNK79_18285 [Chitinophagaceae bacterium]|nr:hypothetical protein [Chitinophagaceae bacterium]